MSAASLADFALRGELGVALHSLCVLPFQLGETFDSPQINFWPIGRLDPHLSAPIYLPRDIFYPHPADVTVGDIAFTQLLYALPAIALAATALRRLAGKLSLAAWMHTVVLVALFTNLFPRADWGHLSLVLPTAAVQLWILLGTLLPRGRRAELFAEVAAVAAIAWIAAVGTSLTLRRYALSVEPSFGPRISLRPLSPGYRTRAVPDTIEYIRKVAEPGDFIFVARAEPLLYFATDTRNPTPFAGVIPGFRERQEAAVLAGLARVRYVIMSDMDSDTFLFYGDELPAVQSYLERYFRVPAEFPIRADTWIYALERGPDRGRAIVDLVKARETARAWSRDTRGEVHPVGGGLPRFTAHLNRRPLPIVIEPGGGGIDYDLELPPGAVLQLAVGPPSFWTAAGIFPHLPGLRLEVSAGDETLERLLSMEIPLDPDWRWHPVEVDLARFGGRRVTLRLAVVPGSELSQQLLNQLHGAISWVGSPRIAVRPERS